MEHHIDPLRLSIAMLLEPVLVDFGGGCSVSKGYVLASLVRLGKLRATVDLGVYRGRSLLPQAYALWLNGEGMAYGVDPWSSHLAVERDHPALNAAIMEWAHRVDFPAMRDHLIETIEGAQLSEHCSLMQMTSHEAAQRFRHDGVSFDLIHIDGNHDRAMVADDFEQYLPLLKRGGVLVMDDVGWDSVTPTYGEALAQLALVFRRRDQWNDYAVFLKAMPESELPTEWRELFRDPFVREG